MWVTQRYPEMVQVAPFDHGHLIISLNTGPRNGRAKERPSCFTASCCSFPSSKLPLPVRGQRRRWSLRCNSCGHGVPAQPVFATTVMLKKPIKEVSLDASGGFW